MNYATGLSDVSRVEDVESYGVVVTAGGLGSSFFNVGDWSDAFAGMSPGEDVQVVDLLLATDEMSLAGVLYDDVDGDGAGDGVLDALELSLRSVAHGAYSSLLELE